MSLINGIVEGGVGGRGDRGLKMTMERENKDDEGDEREACPLHRASIDARRAEAQVLGINRIKHGFKGL